MLPYYYFLLISATDLRIIHEYSKKKSNFDLSRGNFALKVKKLRQDEMDLPFFQYLCTCELAPCRILIEGTEWHLGGATTY